MKARALCSKDGDFYAHVLPALAPHAWQSNRIAGDGWMAVGDAGGLVDPITGEGLYYAVRSADLASQVLLNEQEVDKAASYRRLIARDFGEDLTYAATIAKRFFCGSFLFDAVPNRMVQFMKRSSTFRGITQDLFTGTQPYLELKSRLFHSIPAVLREMLLAAGKSLPDGRGSDALTEPRA